jgi:hypothetical protein
MEQLQENVRVKLYTANPIWSWAARHAAWLLNRFKPARGVTAYELTHGRPYRVFLALFGEPCFAFVKSARKGERKWYKTLFIGKTENQDAFICFDGEKILLSKSIRRVGQQWGLSLCLYKDFCYPSYDYQTGFGARLIPTKREAVALPTAESLIPLEAIVIKKRDYEAEAVAKKAIEEGREENELERMRAHGDMVIQRRLQWSCWSMTRWFYQLLLTSFLDKLKLTQFHFQLYFLNKLNWWILQLHQLRRDQLLNIMVEKFNLDKCNLDKEKLWWMTIPLLQHYKELKD